MVIGKLSDLDVADPGWPLRCACPNHKLVSSGFPLALLILGVAVTMCLAASKPQRTSQAGEDAKHPFYVTPVTKPTPRRPPKCAALDPTKSRALDLKILSGDYLTNARQLDQALGVCGEALRESCTEDQESSAKACISGVVAQRATIDGIQQRLTVIDSLLACFRYKEARSLGDSLRNQFSGNRPSTGYFQGEIGRERREMLSQYIETELGKRSQLIESHPIWQLSGFRGRIGELLGMCPAPSVREVFLWFFEFLICFMVATWFAGLFWHGFVRDKILPEENLWIVWSVIDETKCGASGAVMDALDSRANPLLRPEQNGGSGGSFRLQVPLRPQLWLAPPYLSEQGPARVTTLVWPDLLRSVYGDLPYPLTPIEDIPQDKEMPKFYLDPAYDEVDITVGGFAIKGLIGLRKILRQAVYRKKKSVLGVVSQVESEKIKCWGVRLNANRPGKRREDRTISVYAENSPQEYGDPLSQVAQRAAFKLVLRVLNPALDSNIVTAMAAYRQGIEMLRQLL